MPESKGRDRKAATYTPPPSPRPREPNPTWWAPVFVTLLILGLLWIVIYYITEYKYPIEAIGVEPCCGLRPAHVRVHHDHALALIRLAGRTVHNLSPAGDE